MSEADCGKDGLAAVETNSALPPRAVDFVTVLPSCRSIILRVETMILNTPSLVEKVWDESQAPAGSYQEKTGKKTEHDGFFHMSERLLYTVGSEPKKTPSPWRQQATAKKSIGKRRGDVSQTGGDETLSFDASHMGDTTESRTMGRIPKTRTSTAVASCQHSMPSKPSRPVSGRKGGGMYSLRLPRWNGRKETRMEGNGFKSIHAIRNNSVIV